MISSLLLLAGGYRESGQGAGSDSNVEATASYRVVPVSSRASDIEVQEPESETELKLSSSLSSTSSAAAASLSSTATAATSNGIYGMSSTGAFAICALAVSAALAIIVGVTRKVCYVSLLLFVCHLNASFVSPSFLTTFFFMCSNSQSRAAKGDSSEPLNGTPNQNNGPVKRMVQQFNEKNPRGVIETSTSQSIVSEISQDERFVRRV
jgi:hypothetical protein